MWSFLFTLPVRTEWNYSAILEAEIEHIRVSGMVNQQPLPYLICQAENTDHFGIQKGWIKNEATIYTVIKPMFLLNRRIGIRAIWREGFLSSSLNAQFDIWIP